MDNTPAFDNYESGIYSEKKLKPIINHSVSVVGWGLDEGTGWEYWICRNSYSTYIGEMGFFRIKMHNDNLAIETDCSAAIPSLTKA